MTVSSASYEPIAFGVPTLERPFGLSLWPIFERVFTPLIGYKPQDFRFTSGVTPMSTFWHTGFTLLAYYVVVLGGRELMRGREALKLNALFKIHNLYLTIISGVLLVLFIEQLLPELYHNGIFHAICHKDGGWTDKMVILYYVSSGSGAVTEHHPLTTCASSTI
jgi:fatty acid elongase 3